MAELDQVDGDGPEFAWRFYLEEMILAPRRRGAAALAASASDWHSARARPC
ncbi:uncharacterized protein SOCE26_054320 [Sorangium cellulosum]|uniref:Uncharacterized protein n=1 Tax=Sorangium cellulosum TaxID=56 RepID=A0A2L0EXI0_SORCE|nr:hypothetical protein [Sorangium cellulosum]AUX43975.1 uncharacterized protein SOCE26_054320 [Sorangium cellulosum]